MFDITIIGGGLVGCSIARALSKYDLKVLLIEKERDVSLGASKANSGIVHGGYAGKAGTLKGEMCIKGNEMFDQLDQELNFGFKRIGGLIIGFTESDRRTLNKQYENGLLVGQNDFQWLNREEILLKEPHINPDVLCALYVPSIGITSPYELTIALVENAIGNGVTFMGGQTVSSIEYDHCYRVQTETNLFESTFVINAAGINSGKINHMLGNNALEITPRRGQYVLLGKDQNKINHVIFQTPSDKGKGILVTPTVHGNLMIGPDAEDLQDNASTKTSLERVTKIINQARMSVTDFNIKRALTTFSGIRSMSLNQDFFIRYVSDWAITVGGIDSPGLTSSPAIAAYVVDLLKDKIDMIEKDDYNPYRKSYYNIENDEIVCICEQESFIRIKNCLEGPINIRTTDAVKRRIRAGMGNCQGARCQMKVKKIIAEYQNMDVSDVLVRTEKDKLDRVSINEIRTIKKD